MDIDPTPLTNWLALVIAVFSIVASVVASLTWLLRKRDQAAHQREAELREFILEVTRPIQPETNGGLSLTDLHVKVEKVIDDVEEVRHEQKRIAVELADYRHGQIRREST